MSKARILKVLKTMSSSNPRVGKVIKKSSSNPKARVGKLINKKSSNPKAKKMRHELQDYQLSKEVIAKTGRNDDYQLSTSRFVLDRFDYADEHHQEDDGEILDENKLLLGDGISVPKAQHGRPVERIVFKKSIAGPIEWLVFKNSDGPMMGFKSGCDVEYRGTLERLFFKDMDDGIAPLRSVEFPRTKRLVFRTVRFKPESGLPVRTVVLLM